VAAAEVRKPGDVTTALALDHVGLCARDPAPLWAAWEALGFALSPVARQSGRRSPDGPVEPFGSGNRCAFLRHGYVELLGILDPALFANGVDRFVARHAGAHILALAIGDAEGNLARLRRGGLDIPGIAWLERPVEPGGPTARFARLPFPDAPEGRVQLVQHLTPGLVWDPRWMGHRNGADAIEPPSGQRRARRDHHAARAPHRPAGAARPARRLPPAPARRAGRGRPLARHGDALRSCRRACRCCRASCAGAALHGGLGDPHRRWRRGGRALLGCRCASAEGRGWCRPSTAARRWSSRDHHRAHPARSAPTTPGRAGGAGRLTRASSAPASSASTSARMSATARRASGGSAPAPWRWSRSRGWRACCACCSAAIRAWRASRRWSAPRPARRCCA
jgi:hypothetical protein